MSEPSRAVVMFAKAPVAGRVKTRLQPELTPRQSAALHRAFILDIGDTILRACESGGRPILALAGDEDHEVFVELQRRGFETTEQGGGDLGERLARVTERCFDEGARRVVVTGSDSPTLPSGMLETAFDRLEDVDVVLGPSFDGGYYLAGLRAPFPEIFADIDWSTPAVLPQTLARCRQASRLSELLGFWYDVDDFDDLKFLESHLRGYLCHRSEDAFPNTVLMLRELEANGIFDGQ